MKYNISQVTAFSVQKSICTYNNNYNSLHLIAIVFAYYNYVCVIMMMHIKETAGATDQINHRVLMISLWFFNEF